MKKEVRYFSEPLEVRVDGDKRTISGYAFVYDRESHDLGGFTEVIRKGALEGADMSDVVARFNHNDNFVLARAVNGAGSLKLDADDVGLRYEFEAPNTTAGNDLIENIRLGNVGASSFAFSLVPDGDKWTKRSGGYLREIKNFGGIYDVSPVVHPAYPDTSVAVRSLEQAKEGEKQEDNEGTPVVRELYKRKLMLKQKREL